MERRGETAQWIMLLYIAIKITAAIELLVLKEDDFIPNTKGKECVRIQYLDWELLPQLWGLIAD